MGAPQGLRPAAPRFWQQRGGENKPLQKIFFFLCFFFRQFFFWRDLGGGPAGLTPCPPQVVTSRGSMNRAATEIFCRGVIYHAHGPINWAATKRTGRTLQKGYVLGFRE